MPVRAQMPTDQEHLSIPKTFRITRPEVNQNLQTSSTHYFITGTSDPAAPVYFEGNEIQRLGKQGVFGVYVPLEMGQNTFVFRQNQQTQSITVTRTPLPCPLPIQSIQQQSMMPSIATGVSNGQALEVGCIAPAGSAVTAHYGKHSVQLAQCDQTIKNGLPALYEGKLTIEENVPKNETIMGDAVRYTLDDHGKRQTYTSNGNVFIAGKDSRIAVQVTSYLGFVYYDFKDRSQIKETVKQDARDYVIGETDQYFALASGGYLSKEQAQIQTGKTRIQNKLHSVRFMRDENVETLLFAGSASPIYNTWIADDVFYLELFHTTGTPQPKIAGSQFFSTSRVSKESNYILYQFPLQQPIWGYDVAFQEQTVAVSFRAAPVLSPGNQPLKNMTIVLDPGHGGDDAGALGLAGKTGPDEADVNLAHAKATRDLLKTMGATVVLTREDDSTLSLDERLAMIEDFQADLFLSFHHNSLLENIDANAVSGIEIYYHTPLSQHAAATMMKQMATHLNRNNRVVRQSYYRVTLMPYCPALLLEFGFMSHPLEYENATNDAEIAKVAHAVADGIIEILR